METRCMLSTKDNPYDYFTQFDQWWLYDHEKGYCSCEYLARIARTSDQFSEKENNEEIERAIDEIIALDFRNIYVKVTKQFPIENV